MVEKAIQMIIQLESELKSLKKNDRDLFKVCKQSLVKVSSSCTLFVEELCNYQFKNKKEEIHLFKYVKPKLFSHLFFYNDLFKIECDKPVIVSKQKKYFNKKLNQISKHYATHRPVYQYFKLDDTSIDDRCFVRNNQGQIYFNETGKILYYCEDEVLINDLVFARIISMNQIKDYLQEELLKIDEINHFNRVITDENVNRTFGGDLIWTGSETDFVEACYAFKASGSINNGNVKIKKLVSEWGKNFNINIEDPYKYYHILRGRKQRTKFIDKLKDSLTNEMDVNTESRED